MTIGLSRMGQMGVRSTPMSELNQAIALLRSVGGRMYLPGLTSRVAADGSGGVPVAGDVVGYVPDRVTGGIGPERMTTTTATTSEWTSYNSTLASSEGCLSVANTGDSEGYCYHGKCTVGSTYSVTFTIVSLTGGSAVSVQVGSHVVSRGVGTHTVAFTATNTNGVWLGAGSGIGRNAVYKNVSFKEVTAAMQATTAAKPKLIREPILGPELHVDPEFTGSAWGGSDAIHSTDCWQDISRYAGLHIQCTADCISSWRKSKHCSRECANAGCVGHCGRLKH